MAPGAGMVPSIGIVHNDDDNETERSADHNATTRLNICVQGTSCLCVLAVGSSMGARGGATMDSRYQLLHLRICGRPAAWPAGCEARAGIFYFGNVVGIIYFEGGAVIFYFEGAVGIIYFEGGVFIFYFEGAVGIICFGNAGGLIFFEKARYIFGCKGAGYIVYSENAYGVREYEGVDIGGFGGLRGVGGFGGIGGVGGFVCSMVSKCHSEDSGVQCIRGVGFTYHRQNLLRRCVR